MDPRPGPLIHFIMEKQEGNIQKWETLSSHYIIKRPWLTARRDEVKLPNGTIHPEYYILEYPDWINVVARTREGQYVMVRQYRHGIGQVVNELCAGVIEKGEEPEAAARRELLEETGFGGGHWVLVATLSANASAMNNTTYCFFATDVEKIAAQHLDETEDLITLLLSRDELLGMMDNGEPKQALMAAPLWKLRAGNLL